MIKPIDTWSIDQITSGQVVTSLSSAVKELVENSLDANATVIEVKLVNHGKDGFSVSDNGHGIDPEDFEFIAHKHATSKLKGFEDLSKVQTLGFRGEALASLCALAEVTLTTNSGSGASGFELEFDHMGKVANQRHVAAPRGTLITVNKLFDQLPVRRKTFERGSAREFTKTVELIQEYALLNPARITVEHVVKNRSNSTLRSQGTKLIQRIACIYGAKRTKTLQLIEPDQLDSNWKFAGYISKPVFGMGDSSSTCQLLAVNSRPTSLPRILRAIVELYKQYNFTEQPFFIIDIQAPTESFDINVTPDKRTLLLHDEDRLIDEVKLFLERLFSESGHSVPRMSEIEPPAMKKARQSLVSFAAFSGSGSVINQETRQKAPQPLPEPSDEEEAEEHPVAEGAEADLGDTYSVESAMQSEENASASEYEDQNTSPASPGDSLVPDSATESLETSRPLPSSREAVLEEFMTENFVDSSMLLESNGNETSEISIAPSQLQGYGPSSESESDEGNEAGEDHGEIVEGCHEEENMVIKEEPGVAEKESCLHHHEPQERLSSAPPIQSTQDKQQQASRVSAHLRTTLNTHIHLPLTLEDIDTAMHDASKSHEKTMHRLQTLAIDEEGAEERLQLSIRKEDFDKMEVVGQFNLGFILVVNRKSSHDDLFVIDQHASDEIYNFERLQSSTIMSRQPLVVPQTLELSAAEELTIQEHMSVFENNGFTISIKPENPPGSQCVLTSVPYSKSTVFNERDVFELLSKLKEDHNQPKLRCSKLRSMFAMRACRSSIMIGTPLKLSTMEIVVKHMGTLDKPWNCPHGRPTLRHITTLS